MSLKIKENVGAGDIYWGCHQHRDGIYSRGTGRKIFCREEGWCSCQAVRSIGCVGSISNHVSIGAEGIRMKMSLSLGTKTVCLAHLELPCTLNLDV